ALLAHWDGSSWSLVPTPLGGAGSYLADVSAAGPRTVWAGGGVASAGGGLAHTALVRFDGTSWTEVGAPANPPDTESWGGTGGGPDGSVWLVGSTSGPGSYPFGNPFVARSCQA